MKAHRILLPTLILSLAATVSAAHGQEPDPITHTLTSSASGQERTFTVQLPRSYHDREEGAYPVLYVLDGESNLEHASSVVAFLAETGSMPEAIVVGVHAGATRAQDYLPGSAVAGAQSPYLDEAIGTPLVARVTEVLETGTTDPGFLFATLGEEPELEQNFGRLGAVLASADGPLRGATATEAGASHIMTRLVGLYDGLLRFFGETWPVSDQALAGEGAAGFEGHLGELERRFRYPVLYGEPGFQRALQVLLSTGDAAGAVEVGRRYVRQYPSSVIGHFLLGNALAANGDREGAVRSIHRAIERYEAEPDARTAPVYENMKTLLGRLTGTSGPSGPSGR